MERQLVAWMLRGGERVEAREQRLQRFYRSELRLEDATVEARGWRAFVPAALGRRQPAHMDPIAQCCAA